MQEATPIGHSSHHLKLARTQPQPREARIHVEDLLHEGVDRATLWQRRELVVGDQSNYLFFVFFPRLRASSLNLR